MSNMMYDQTPEPNVVRFLFSILMLVLPLVGFYLYRPEGFFIGLFISTIGLIYLFSTRKHIRNKCEVCGREVMNLGRGSKSAEAMNMGAFIRTSDLIAGREIFGDKCLRCGRIYCHNCAQYGMKCKCGSDKFRTVKLRYR